MDSYLTTLELDELVLQLFTPDELDKVGWSELSDTDKSVLLTRATNYIDTFAFRGKPSSSEQDLKFPRVINKVDVGIPLQIKKCTAHLVFLYLEDKKSSRKQLQKDGVKRVSAGKVTEEYQDNLDFYTLNKDTINGYLNKYLVKGVLR